MAKIGGGGPGHETGGHSASALMADRYIAFLRWRWWMVMGCVGIAAALAAAYIIWWPVSYSSKAHLLVTGKIRLAEGSLYNEQEQNFEGTQIELFLSDMIQRRALARVRDVLHVPLPLESDGKVAPVSLRATQVSKSGLLELKASGRTEQYVRAFLDSMMEEFLAYKREVRTGTAGDTYTSVSEQVARQSAELKTEQDKLVAYQRENNVAVLEEQAKAGSAFLTQLLADLSKLKLEDQILQATSSGKGQSDAEPGGPTAAPDLEWLPEAALSSSESLRSVGAAQDLERLKIRKARLGKYFRPKHPKMVKLDEEIFQSEKLADYFSRQSHQQLQMAKQSLSVKLQSVQQAIKEWEAKVNTTSERIAEYNRLRLNADRVQAFHDRLLGMLQSVDVSRNVDQENITILDHASEAIRSKQPVPVVAGFSLLLGLCVGLGLVFFVERFDDTITSLDDLNGQFGDRVLGQIPEMENKKEPGLLDAKGKWHFYEESYRSIRSALLFGSGKTKPKLLLVASAIPGEGKSTVAANLARTMARAGERVLLIDGNLRTGILHKHFGVPQEPGLSDCLKGGGTLDKMLVSTSLPKLMLLTRGESSSNAGELFLSAEFGELLTRIRERFDWVLLDSISLFAADDTTSVAPKVDGVLLVVRSLCTSARALRHSLELLNGRQAKVLGLILNGTSSASPSFYCKYPVGRSSPEAAKKRARNASVPVAR